MLHVVLFEPEIPGNAGNVIRLCANSGATLHMIKPLGFRLDDKHLRRSGLDYHDLAAVKVHGDLRACLDELAGARLFTIETGAPRCYSDVSYQDGDALIFGPETRGLPAALVEQIGADNCLQIPMRAKNRSINLSNAVALVVFEAWRQSAFAVAPIDISRTGVRLLQVLKICRARRLA